MTLSAVCPRKALLDAVKTVSAAVSGRSSLPILSHILIREEMGGLRLCGNDLEMSISCRIPADVHISGEATVHAKTLAGLLTNLPEKSDVSLRCQKDFSVKVQCDTSQYKILGMNPEEYPSRSEPVSTASFRIPQAKLQGMIRQTRFAVGTNDERPILMGILMDFSETTLKMVSTDTHRLAVKEATVFDGSGTEMAIVPARAMNELSRLLTSEQGAVEVRLSQNEAIFVLDGEDQTSLTTRLIDGRYPVYSRIIPTERTTRLTIPVAPFKSALKRAEIVATEDSHRILFCAEGEKLALTASSVILGDAFEEIDVELDGEEKRIILSGKMLLEFLEGFEADRFYLDMTEPLRPVVIRTVFAENAEPAQKIGDLYIQMPMGAR